MTIDATLASSSIAGLAWDFRSLLSGGIEGTTLPVDGATRERGVGGGRPGAGGQRDDGRRIPG